MTDHPITLNNSLEATRYLAKYGYSAVAQWDMAVAESEPLAWCRETLGPCAIRSGTPWHVYQFTPHRWAYIMFAFWFRDPQDAVLFKLRWG